jgi:hypothetical protein
VKGLAPLLHELEVRGVPVDRGDPVQVAYAIRDAAQIARPDLLVATWDEGAEIGTLCTPDAPHRGVAAVVKCVETLTALGLDIPIAARLFGPWTLSGAVSGADDRGESREDSCEELADRLTEIIDPLAQAGAAAVIVWESGWEGGSAALERAHATLTRRLSLAGLEPILRCPAGAEAGGYDQVLAAGSPTLIPPPAFSTPHSLSEALMQLEDETDEVWVLSDGAVPAGTPVESLQVLAAAPRGAGTGR